MHYIVSITQNRPLFEMTSPLLNSTEEIRCNNLCHPLTFSFYSGVYIALILTISTESTIKRGLERKDMLIYRQARQLGLLHLY